MQLFSAIHHYCDKTADRAAQASLDNTATLEALARSAKLGERVADEI